MASGADIVLMFASMVLFDIIKPQKELVGGAEQISALKPPAVDEFMTFLAWKDLDI